MYCYIVYDSCIGVALLESILRSAHLLIRRLNRNSHYHYYHCTMHSDSIEYEEHSIRTIKFFRPIKARGGVQGQKLDFLSFFIVKSSNLDGIVTFYRMKISSPAL